MKPGQYYGVYCMIMDGPSCQQVAAATHVGVMHVHTASIEIARDETRLGKSDLGQVPNARQAATCVDSRTVLDLL